MGVSLEASIQYAWKPSYTGFFLWHCIFLLPSYSVSTYFISVYRLPDGRAVHRFSEATATRWGLAVSKESNIGQLGYFKKYTQSILQWQKIAKKRGLRKYIPVLILFNGDQKHLLSSDESQLYSSQYWIHYCVLDKVFNICQKYCYQTHAALKLHNWPFTFLNGGILIKMPEVKFMYIILYWTTWTEYWITNVDAVFEFASQCILGRQDIIVFIVFTLTPCVFLLVYYRHWVKHHIIYVSNICFLTTNLSNKDFSFFK